MSDDNERFSIRTTGKPVTGPFAVQPRDATEWEPADFTLAPVNPDLLKPEHTHFASSVMGTLTTLKSMFAAVPRGDYRRERINHYIEHLTGIARNGLQFPADPVSAAPALANLQDEVRAREAGPIKNQYMKVLGAWAMLLSTVPAAVFLLIYVCILWIKPKYGFGAIREGADVIFVWAGATVGCWLSFGIRRVDLTFQDLGRLEADLLEPGIRLLFTGILALTLALIFKSGMVVIEIGGLNTAKIDGSVLVALLVGLFCGIGEQALPSTIGRRASQFLEQATGK